MAFAFLCGAGIPILMYAPTSTGLSMLGMGLILSVIFVALAMLAAVITGDKAKGYRRSDPAMVIFLLAVRWYRTIHIIPVCRLPAGSLDDRP